MRDVFWNGFADEVEKLGGHADESPNYRKALKAGGNLTPGGRYGAYRAAVEAGARSHQGEGLGLPASIPVSRWDADTHRKVLDAAGPSPHATPDAAANVREALTRAANATDRMRAEEKPAQPPAIASK
jgi:hypothetical protein